MEKPRAVRAERPTFLCYKTSLYVLTNCAHPLLTGTSSGMLLEMRKSKYTPGNFKLRVRRAVVGKGLFAEETIPKGACIIEYTGRPVSPDEMERDNGKYLFWTSRKTMIDGNIPSNTARYINHSCRPNCEAEGPAGKVFIMARRNIKPGEELTYDYGKEYFNRHIKPYGCRCPKCLARK
jgi:uncharacterized protein